MSTEFRGAPGKTRKLEDNLDNTAYESIPEHPPGLKMGIGISEFAFGLFTNVVQVVTTAIAIMSMVLGATSVRTTNVVDLLRVFPYAAIIALVIAGAIQLFLHKNA